jgi:fused signal recognition particle receptor
MFNFLKKRFRKSVEEISEKITEEKESGIKGAVKKITEKKLSEKDIDELFKEWEPELLQANVALEVIDFLKKGLKEKIAGKGVKRTRAKQFVADAFKKLLLEVVNQGTINLEEIIKEARSRGKPACFVFLGFNGSGKTSSIAKLAKYLLDKKYKVVLAAGDTWRSAAIEQLEHHGRRLGVKTIKHQYGSDSAAVVFDAIKYAEANNCDVVLADTAGRTHTDKNLMDELAKVVRVNRPELKILVVDSLTGTDVLQQAIKFNEAVGIDAMVFTKIDVNKKGGSLLSACYAVKKPILFLGTGQNYEDLEIFDPKKLVKSLFE